MAFNALVVYESIYGNTHQVAQEIGNGLSSEGADVRVLPVAGAPAAPDVDVLVVGGPTHMHGMTTGHSRRLAVEGAHEDAQELDPSATEGEGLRPWLRRLPDAGRQKAAAFDTRLDRSAALTGSAAHGIGRRLRHRGYDVVGRESFIVDDAEGPLADGELDRARAFGSSLAGQLMRGRVEKSRA